MSTEISQILTISETCPKDFYTNGQYLEQTKEALEVAKSLVHTIDEEGKKKAQSDAAAIRKYVKTTNSFTKTVFDSLTGKVKAWRETFTDHTKELSQAADDIMEKFDDLEKAKIAETEKLILSALHVSREKAEITDTFITRPELKITLAGWVTPGGVLTKKSNDLVRSIVESELAQQFQYFNRCNVVKIQCLEADINPAFDPDVLGDAMFTKSEDVFLFKLKSLIDLEKERIQKQEERNKAKQEADKQAAIDKALFAERQQALKNAAQENLKEPAYTPEMLRDPEPPPQAGGRMNLTTAFHLRRQADEIEKQQAIDQTGTRLVTYTIVFQAKVKNTTTNEQFMQMIKKEVECSGRALKAIISEVVE